MAETDNLRLPYLMAAQAQKHVTHNEALRSLDAVVQLAVEDRDLTDPPPAPADGARYLVAAAATGDWTGHEGEIAAYQDGAWMFHTAREGWIAWIADEDAAVVYDGTGWVTLSGGGGSVNPAPLVGVNATADTTNRLSVSSPASLLNHEGAGHQLKLNKATAADTASLLYQTAFSGRAEMGLTGDDDFHFKVSADGTAWNDAIVVDKGTGAVSFPNTTLGGGGGFVPFASQAKVTFDSAASLPHAVSTLLTWGVEVRDDAGYFTPGSPTRLTIPASGVSAVIIFASVRFTAAVLTAAGTVRHKNSGGTEISGPYTFEAAGVGGMLGSLAPTVVPVSAGDYFTLEIYQTSTGSASRNLWTDGRVFFQIAAVEPTP